MLNSMTVHESFEAAKWIARFPLDKWFADLDSQSVADFRFQPPHDLFSPFDVAISMQMLERAGWRPDASSQEVDLLIPALGEPSMGSSSKVGGRPSRPSGVWPKDGKGRDLVFHGQLCFAESRDIVEKRIGGELPGDTLLIFSEDDDDLIWNETEGSKLHFEWHAVETQVLATPPRPQLSPWTPVHFQRLRFFESEMAPRTMSHGGRTIEVSCTFRASKMGGVAAWQQSPTEADGLGVLLGCLHSINPYDREFPLVNVPVLNWDPLSHGFLMLGDVGTLFLFWDGKRVRWTMQCG